MRDRALFGVVVALVAWIALAQSCNDRRVAEAEARVDSLRTEELAARAEAAGWEARLVETTSGLSRRLQEAEEEGALLAREKAELAREVETLGAELRVVADMYADLAGSIEAHDATVHRADPEAEPDSITAHVDDGLLEGRLVYRPPTTLAIDPYRVELAIALGWIEAADGRALVTARAADPRVELRYGDVFYDAPEPVAFCPLGKRIEAGAWGFAIGATAQPLFELVRSLMGGR